MYKQHKIIIFKLHFTRAIELKTKINTFVNIIFYNLIHFNTSKIRLKSHNI